jgi:hypothetical protein
MLKGGTRITAVFEIEERAAGPDTIGGASAP